jgi:hypothetical protein
MADVVRELQCNEFSYTCIKEFTTRSNRPQEAKISHLVDEEKETVLCRFSNRLKTNGDPRVDLKCKRFFTHGHYYNAGYYPYDSPFFGGFPVPVPIPIPGF